MRETSTASNASALSADERVGAIAAARVLGRELSLLDALRIAKSHLLLGFVDDAIEIVLVRAEAARRSLTASDEELQRAVDAMRRERGLEKAQAFSEWLSGQGAALEDLETWAELQVLRAKLQDALADPSALAAWVERAPARGDAPSASIAVDNRGLALELVRLCREEGAPFERLEKTYSLGSGAAQLSAAARARVAELPMGAVSEPVELDGLWYIFRRGATDPAQLSGQDLLRAKAEIFSDWLSAQKARVERLLPPRLSPWTPR